MVPSVRSLVVVAFTAVVIATMGERGDALAADAGAPAALPACVQVTTQSLYVPYGYNHVVTIKNGCSRIVACSVATDVNPEPQTLEVSPSTSVDVTTFMGAASSTFLARVGCRLK